MSALTLSHDFECANAGSVTRLAPDHWRVVTRPDDALNGGRYASTSYYAAIRLHNPAAVAQSARVTIFEPVPLGSWRTLATRVRQPGQRAPLLAWTPLPESAIIQDEATRDYGARVTVPPGAELDLTTMYWYAASEIMADLAQLGRQYPALRQQSVATSAEGRQVPMVELGPATAPCLVLTATPQSHELGSIAVMGLLQAVLDGELRDLAERLRLVFFPLTNPDGNAHGTCMANARQQNLVFGFGAPGATPESPECAGIWQAVTARQPAALLEWHSYPHLNRPSFRAYEMAGELYPAKVRERGLAFARLLRSVALHPPVPVRPGTDMAAQFGPSLIARLVTEYGIPATLYKLHNRETIPDNLAHARQITRALASWLLR